MTKHSRRFAFLSFLGWLLVGCGESEPARTPKPTRGGTADGAPSSKTTTPDVPPSPLAGMTWGNLTGRFIYDGAAPSPKPVVVNADVAEFGQLNLVDESLVVDPTTGGIANVVIYVRTKDVKINPELENSVEKEVKFDNRGGRFVPRVLPVWLGRQTLSLCNSDRVAHNSNMQPVGETAVNPLIAAGGMVEHRFNFEQAVPVSVSCNIHRWMQGYILPRNDPYVAVTNTDGSFTLGKLPADTELEFQVWQEKSGPLETKDWKRGRFKMTLKAGANDLGTIKLKPSLFEK